MADVKKALGVTGHAIQGAARLAGRKMAEAYRAVDPDVFRHVAQVPLLSHTLFVARRETLARVEPDGHPPLLFVHGLGGNRGNFLLMEGYFRMRGRRRSYKVSFEPGQGIEQMAEALAAFVRQVQDVTGEPKVEMVAHSLGGIVARLAIQEHGLADAVGTLVTLGTPHAGTYPARFANTEVTRMLRPGSALIQRMEAAEWPKAVRGVALFSENDLFVLPAASAAPGIFEAINVTPFTHYSYLLSPKSWKTVWGVLAG